MKLEVHTLRYGTADWIRLCAPRLEAWCGRHGFPLRVWGDDFPHYPCPKFCEIDMLRSFLDGDSTHMLYVDTDVWVADEAPAPDMLHVPGFHAATDTHHATHYEPWREWCRQQFGELPATDTYHNAAVWVCDREAAQRFLSRAQPPFIEALMEEYQWNWWLTQARRDGMAFNLLDNRWNRSNRDHDPSLESWFIHVWGTDKEAELAKLAA